MLYLEQKVVTVGEEYTVTVKFYHRVSVEDSRMQFVTMAMKISVDVARQSRSLCLFKGSPSKAGLRTAMKPTKSRLMGITSRLRALNIVPVKANTSLLVTDTKSVTAVTPAIPIAADNTKPAICQPGLQAASIVKLPVQESCPDVKTTTSPLHQSPIAPLPIIASSEDIDQCLGLSKEASSNETQSWLTCNRFSQHAATFTNFSGADLLRLSRDDLIQICGLADGIRLFNALHAKGLEARLTIYVSYGSDVYSAIYLHSWSAAHLCDKLRTLIPHPVESVLVAGPNGTRVRLTDDVVRHLRDNSTYRLQPDANATILMTPARHGTP